MDGFLHFFKIPCAEIAADDNTGAHAKSHEETGHHEDKVSAAGNCGKGFFSHKVADYDAVGGVIKLLKKMSDKNRNGKTDKTFPYRTFCHINSLCRTFCCQKNISFGHKIKTLDIILSKSAKVNCSIFLQMSTSFPS